ncbi:MAG: HlyD family efflux transporter periplasmic adaptor subunit [Verrucomicrobia bacterium]|nr:MAG: HlyD family efflux transporter periplasmic adaptor subunit [Verrucomicrobiota bacterium]
MKGVKPIPTPARLRWREFRIQALPWVVYAAAVAAVATIWVRYVVPPQMVGQVDLQQAQVLSTQAGRLVDVAVEPFQTVRAGEVVARVITTDPAVLESTLAVIRAEVALLREQSDPVLTRERAQVDFERLRLDWLEQRVALAAARARLAFAEAEAARLESLEESPEGIVSRSELELALSNREALAAEVREMEAMVARIETSMKKFQRADIERAGDSNEAGLRAALDLQESRLRQAEAELAPLVLRAPIDGVVSAVHRRSGENVTAGDPILTITSPRSDRIVAYVVPPIRLEPRPGMEVEVIRRSGRRESARARITHVGQYMEMLPQSLTGNAVGEPILVGRDRLPGGATGPITWGIPLEITLPPELGLRPGELVDLRWVPGSLEVASSQ